MKTLLVFLMLLVASVGFGQDLKLDINNVYLWNVTTPTPQNCAIQMGYDGTGSPTTKLIRMELDITNWGVSDVSFPASQVWYNPCREQKEVKDLVTLQIYNKNGALVHSHVDGMKVGDFGHNYYFKETTPGCNKILDIYSTNFDQLPDSVFGISALHFHRSNSFPSGYQLGIATSYLPAVADTYQLKPNLNISYLNQGDNCNSDTASQWVFIDAANNVLQKVSPPSGRFQAPDPCTDADLPITTASINTDTRTITCDGSACGEKYIARYINFGAGQILPDDGYGKNFVFTFYGKTWKDETALNQKELEAYCALYPGVVKKGKPSYFYRLFNHTTTLADNIVLKNVRYSK